MPSFPRRSSLLPALLALAALAAFFPIVSAARPGEPAKDSKGGAPPRPNILLILADDLGYSDLGCYGSDFRTPNLDALSREGVRFTQFYNGARCCPTRASLLTGLYPHQAGVGHQLQQWHPPGYTNGLNDRCVTTAQVLRDAGYRNYQVGKWHAGGLSGAQPGRNFPLERGFDRFYGTDSGWSYFAPRPLFLDRESVTPGPDFYATDRFSDYAVRFLAEHQENHRERPFFMNLCYTAPHFPLHAKPEDIARYRDRYRDGWDAMRASRFARLRELGIIDPRWRLSPRDPVAQPWEAVADKEEWAMRMAIHAAMVDCMDQGIGRVLAQLRQMGAAQNTLVLFLSDNGASAEARDAWPNPTRGHKPGSRTGTPESHRTLEIGWANAANTPFRENKMWTHEGGISTPLIVRWPAGLPGGHRLNRSVGHVIDIMPTLLDAAGATYPPAREERALLPLEGRSLLPACRGGLLPERILAWEHEGNRALRRGDWKIVASYRGLWELYDMAADRTETRNLAAQQADRVRELAALWQAWADRVGVVPWEQLPGASYQPTPAYRRKSEPVPPAVSTSRP